VQVTNPGNKVDCGGATGINLQVCQMGNTPSTTSNKKVCTETPVAINPDYESSQLNRLQSAYEKLVPYHHERTAQCYAKVVKMHPEQAYSLYKRDAEA
jgi:hypothetical protein